MERGVLWYQKNTLKDIAFFSNKQNAIGHWLVLSNEKLCSLTAQRGAK